MTKVFQVLQVWKSPVDVEDSDGPVVLVKGSVRFTVEHAKLTGCIEPSAGVQCGRLSRGRPYLA